jgi:hypothetical protein
MFNVQILEDIPEEEKDWHPGPNNQVLDIIHLSLYCLVYNQTLAYPPVGTKGESKILRPLSILTELSAQLSTSSSDYCVSTKFSWIPTDFLVSNDGTKVSALGYINNLHPSHKALYQAIERALTAFVPLSERVLSDIHVESTTLSRTRTVGRYSHEGEDDFEYVESLDEEAYKDYEMTRPMRFPTVPAEGYKPDLVNRALPVSLRGRPIQVITKLANIELVCLALPRQVSVSLTNHTLKTPENPQYTGGKWHVEGQ